MSPSGKIRPAPRSRAGLAKWITGQKISEVECLVADMSGIARGKILPADKFIQGDREGTLRLPDSVFSLAVSGDSVRTRVLEVTEPDVRLHADPSSARLVPWYDEPTAQVICDAVTLAGKPVDVAPRSVLRRVLEAYESRGWRAVVAPELEFFLAARNIDPDYPLEPPAGSSGRPETGRQSYGIDAVNAFDPIFEDVYDYCEAQRIDIDTLIHEAGAAQVEINFNHGDPLAMADQAFLFKRTVRQAALRHGIYATFMARPYEREPGSAMHLHQSVTNLDGRNLFATRGGRDTALFRRHIAGLQNYLPAAMALLAPNVNSYRRIVKWLSAPVNTHWGHENRTVGLRVPSSESASRRIENRVPGADANPYLAIAASLACGYLGMCGSEEPTAPMEGNAYEAPGHSLPRSLPSALESLAACVPLHDVLGSRFVTLFSEVKQAEHDAYHQVISAWEREHLLLNV